MRDAVLRLLEIQHAEGEPAKHRYLVLPEPRPNLGTRSPGGSLRNVRHLADHRRLGLQDLANALGEPPGALL